MLTGCLSTLDEPRFAGDPVDSEADTEVVEDTDVVEDSDVVEDTEVVEDTPAGETYTVIGLEFTWIPAGSFVRGCQLGRDDVYGEDCTDTVTTPVHDVELSKGFYMSVTEFTRGAWAQLYNQDPADPTRNDSCVNADCPVDNVSWYQVVQLANDLSAAEGLDSCYTVECTGQGEESCSGGKDARWATIYDCPGYRLPTSAEWEYAARAGQDDAFGGSDDPGDVADFGQPSGADGLPACSYQRNAWGLCDMAGNVREWVDNGHEVYQLGRLVDPVPDFPGTSQNRECRGATRSMSEARFLGVHRRTHYPAFSGVPQRGFRLMRRP